MLHRLLHLHSSDCWYVPSGAKIAKRLCISSYIKSPPRLAIERLVYGIEPGRQRLIRERWFLFEKDVCRKGRYGAQSATDYLRGPLNG